MYIQRQTELDNRHFDLKKSANPVAVMKIKFHTKRAFYAHFFGGFVYFDYLYILKVGI